MKDIQIQLCSVIVICNMFVFQEVYPAVALDRAYTSWSQSRWQYGAVAGFVTVCGAVSYPLLHNGDKRPAYIGAAVGVCSMFASWCKLAHLYQVAEQDRKISFASAILKTGCRVLAGSATDNIPLPGVGSNVAEGRSVRVQDDDSFAQREFELKENIHTLCAATVGDIQVVRGNRNVVTVRAPRNVLEGQLRETCTNGRLDLSLQGSCTGTSSYSYRFMFFNVQVSSSATRSVSDVHYTVTLVAPESLTALLCSGGVFCNVTSIGDTSKPVRVQSGGSSKVSIDKIVGSAMQVDCEGTGGISIGSSEVSSVIATVTGPSNCQLSGLNVSGNIKVDVSGIGDCRMLGNCQSAFIVCSGWGWCNASGLNVSGNIKVDVSGIGHCRILGNCQSSFIVCSGCGRCNSVVEDFSP